MSPSFLARASRRLRGLALLCGVLAGCGGQDQPGAKDVAQQVAKTTDAQSAASKTKTPVIEGDRLTNFGPIVLSKQTETSPFRFRDAAPGSGVDFVHFSGMTEARHFPTANGSGVAVFDYDNDGKLDLYFATCTLIPLGTATKGPNKLYRNLGGGKFEDVTARSGLGFEGFCHGIVVGDIDNDGDQDVFLCVYGSNRLFENLGNGKFQDISKSAGIDSPNWSSSGAFIDYDGDGDLDLYVSNYGSWKYPDDQQFCGDVEKKIPLYCSPKTVRTVPHLFYRNNGDKTFTEVSAQVGIARSGERAGHGFGVVTGDFNDDGKPDIYVANDMNPNFLFLNKGDGTFEDVTEYCGAAFDERGDTHSGMGVDAEDFDGDLLPDFFVTNFANEPNILFKNQGKGIFTDLTSFVGLMPDSMPWVGWGCALADFDNDGRPDTFVTNGHVDDNRQDLGQKVEYNEPAILMRNIDGKKFKLATRDAGPYFAETHNGRGAAFGDLDNDGRIDIVVNQKESHATILLNRTPGSNRWIRFVLQGTKSNRDAFGAKVIVEIDNPDKDKPAPLGETWSATRRIARQRKGGGSMESAHDPRLLFGVGTAKEVLKATIDWPSGQKSMFEHLETNKTYKIVEGDPKPVAAELKVVPFSD